MKDLLQAIFLQKERVQGKQLIFVLDGAREHGPERTNICVIKAPPNSPQLNLCEYYNRTIRSKANRIRHISKFQAQLLGRFTHTLDGFFEIIETAIDEAKGIVQSHSFVTLLQVFHK